MKLPDPPYCHCGAKMERGEIAYGPQATCWQDTKVQYCARCERMSHVPQEKQATMYAPLRGVAPLGWKGNEDGTGILQWSTDVSGERIAVMDFTPYPRQGVNMKEQGRDHLLKLWQKLDASIDIIRQPTNDGGEYQKGHATALADVIAQLMSPFYADETAVLAESMARWEARQERREHQSPGLAEREWDPATRFDNTAFSSDTAPSRKARSGGAKPTKALPTLGEAQVTFVKHQLTEGGMDATVLAGMFEVPVEVIQKIADDL